MKKVALLATVGLALFATAALAHQYRGEHNGGHGRYSQVQQSGYRGAGCPMNTGMNGWGMMNYNGMHRGMYNSTRPGTYPNRHANPAYQGQATPDASVE